MDDPDLDLEFRHGWEFRDGIVYGQFGFAKNHDRMVTQPLGKPRPYFSSSSHLIWFWSSDMALDDPKNTKYRLNRETLELEIYSGKEKSNSMGCHVYSSLSEYEAEFERLRQKAQDRYDIEMKNNKI